MTELRTVQHAISIKMISTTPDNDAIDHAIRVADTIYANG